MNAWIRNAAIWKRIHWFTLGTIVIVSGWARVAAVLGTTPYSQHVDEVHLTRTAVNILKTGDPNPHFFKYPSLPIYVSALTMRAATPGRAGDPSKWQIPTKGGPYEPSRGFTALRVLFALMSIVALALSGVIARSLFDCDALLVLAPLFLSTSHVYQTSGALYLNVDVVTVLFLLGALTASFRHWGSDTVRGSALLPGILVGLSTASKYTGGITLLPCALAIVLGQKRRRARKLVILCTAAALVFLVCVPYSVLDHTQFIADVKWEIHHYKTGHPRFDGPPGIPQLEYYWRELLRDYGPFVLMLTLLGFLSGLLHDVRRTLTFAALPLGLLLQMSTNRVHFVRTVLPVFALVPVLAAGGIAGIERAISALLSRSRWRDRVPRLGGRPAVPDLIAAIAFVGVWLTLDKSSVLDRGIAPDTRNIAATWLREHARGRIVFLAPELRMSPSRIEGLRTRSVAPRLADVTTVLAATHGELRYLVVPRFKAGAPIIRWVGGRRVIAPPPPDPMNSALAETKARRVLDLPGDLTSPYPGSQLSDPVRRPALIVYEVPPQ